MTATAASALLLDKPLPPSPITTPPAVPEKDMDKLLPRPAVVLSSPAAHHPHLSSQVDVITRVARATSLSQQSTHSQSSISDKSIISNSSGGGSGSSSDSNSHTTTSTPSTSASEGTSESVGQLSLQRFPTGESIAHRVRSSSSSSKSKSGDHSTRLSLDGLTRPSRTTSTTSSSSARSSSGSAGFKFSKPSLSFKPLLYNHGNGSKDQHHLYQHNSSNSSSNSPSTSPNGHAHQSIDPFANSPFPSVLMTIKLPQSLLDKYVIDQEGFRQGKGIWGIGQYSWTITVLSKTNGKKYAIKRVSKSLLPPSAYYHYPRTAHQLCTCPACRSSREQLLLTGQLDQHELENIQEVLVIQNKGRKELPQLPTPSTQQQQQQQQRPPLQRPLSATSVATTSSRGSLDKRRSFHLCGGLISPTPQSKILSTSPTGSPLGSPVSSRPSTPTLLRLFSSSAVPTSSTTQGAPKSQSRPLNHYHTICSPPRKTQSTDFFRSPLLSTLATPLLWSQKKESDAMVAQTRPESSFRETQPIVRASLEVPSGSMSRASGHRYSQKKKPALWRHASTPNLLKLTTGLDSFEDDSSDLDDLKKSPRLRITDWNPQGRKNQRHQLDTNPFLLGTDRQYLDSPLPMTPTVGPFQSPANDGASDERSLMDESVPPGSPSLILTDPERKISPFDTNEGEFKQMEPESPRPSKAPEHKGYVPPPHALPMELVLLQTFNDSDHLPEHHEWTQDEHYWYYVTKTHGVRRRKLKKVSTWWLDMGSFGSALLSGSSNSSEPIATGPIYNMGHATGASTPNPTSSSPLSSEVALSSGRQTPTPATQEPTNAVRKQSSPRNSSHMGKYFYVNWDEYLSC